MATRLNESGIILTDLEKQLIQSGINWGSYYFENNEDEEDHFLGWNLPECAGDPKVFRGVAAFLIQKGVLSKVTDEGESGFYILYNLDFGPENQVIFN